MIDFIIAMRVRFLFLAVALGFFGTCCSSPTAIQSPPRPLVELSEPLKSPWLCTVGISAPEGPGMDYKGTGVVVHSSKHGTIVMTNHHVVMVKPAWSRLPLPATVYKVFIPNEPVLEAAYLTSVVSYQIKEHYIDVALLWIPYDGKIYQAFSGIRKTAPVIDEPVRVYTFYPQNRVLENPGAIEKTSDGDTVVVTESAVVPGNSGSGVYDLEGVLVGVIFAKNSTDENAPTIETGPFAGKHHDYGYFVQSTDLRSFFEASELAWVPTPDPSDDPPIPEQPK